MHERTTISISFGSISMIDFRPLPGTDHTTSVEDHTLDSSARAPRLFARSSTLSQHFRSRTDRLNWDYDSGVRGGDEESLWMVLLILCFRFFLKSTVGRGRNSEVRRPCFRNRTHGSSVDDHETGGVSTIHGQRIPPKQTVYRTLPHGVSVS